MQNKLQELTEQLYNEGLAKGREAGDRYLEEARQKSERTIEDARKSAGEIIAKAEKEAADLKAKAQADIRMASAQALQATRACIENLIIAKAVDTPVKNALSETAFLKEIISAVATRFSAQESTDIALLLPENLQKELEPFVQGELAKTLGKGVEASFSKKVEGGFKIGPGDGSYFIDLTDESFRELIGDYLRPATKKILFG